jgi:hypothetical protein
VPLGTSWFTAERNSVSRLYVLVEEAITRMVFEPVMCHGKRQVNNERRRQTKSWWFPLLPNNLSSISRIITESRFRFGSSSRTGSMPLGTQVSLWSFSSPLPSTRPSASFKASHASSSSMRPIT